MEFRRMVLLLPLDDLMAVVREFINPHLSRAGLDRRLHRHCVANLRELQAQAPADAGEAQAPVKTFKSHEPSFLRVDTNTCRRCPTRARGAICSSPSMRHALGVHARLRRSERDQQRGVPKPLGAHSADEDLQTADRQRQPVH